jgi:hypothetical protein
MVFYVSATLADYLLQAPIQITAREREILELVAGGRPTRTSPSSSPSACGRFTPTWTGSTTRPAPAAAPVSPGSRSSAASSPASPIRGSSAPSLLGILAVTSRHLRQRRSSFGAQRVPGLRRGPTPGTRRYRTGGRSGQRRYVAGSGRIELHWLDAGAGFLRVTFSAATTAFSAAEAGHGFFTMMA